MIDELTAQHWDVIVVGTGMGGATIGYALAKAGKRVLFCERGRSQATSDALTGRYAEDCFDPPSVPQPRHLPVLAKAGRNWEEIEDRTKARVKRFVPFMGAGTGGSSALYGMALERMFPEDFRTRVHHPTANGSSLPEAWPIDYDELVPYYERAESLYRVRGGRDALRGLAFQPGYLQAPPMTAAAQELFDYLNARGFHPYRLPLACEFKPGCQCCQGYLCPADCKNDSHRVCLRPALTEFGAQLIDECEVVRLEASPSMVTKVVCQRGGQTFGLHSSVVILAAGALHTPKLLLNSASPLWPRGLANSSGLVGRNLMRHYVDLYLIRRTSTQGLDIHAKELAFSDLYLSRDGKLGSVQSFGALPSAAHLVESLGHDLHQGSIPFVGTFYKFFRPLLHRYLDRSLSGSLILASIVEDLPFIDNRVDVDRTTGRLCIHYHLYPQERRRIQRMRLEMRQLLKPYQPMVIRQAENNERLAHACGTCRFGLDPAASVLNRHSRAHDVENLYVADASIFPSSGGTNPSLTIAAIALRLADYLTARCAALR